MSFVTLKELSDRIGVERSAARRWLVQASARLGFEPSTLRSPDTRGQSALAWTVEQAEALVACRRQMGFAIDAGPPVPTDRADTGVLYLIRLAPDLAPNRVKVGFAAVLEQRLRDHRCAAPTCEIEKVWPCNRSWEPAALAVVAAVADRQLSPEAFDVHSVDETVARLDRFFALLVRDVAEDRLAA